MDLLFNKVGGEACICIQKLCPKVQSKYFLRYEGVGIHMYVFVILIYIITWALPMIQILGTKS